MGSGATMEARCTFKNTSIHTILKHIVLILFFYNAMQKARWWPEIPVIVAIIIASVVMIVLCKDVYKTEQEANRWRQEGNAPNNTMSNRVFWQSFWYLVVFYATWPPYLALQYLWSSGKAYSMYGFVLFASTLVPMQGFWNYVAFRRLEIARQMAHAATSMSARVVHFSQRTRTSRFSQRNSNMDVASSANEASKKKELVSEPAKEPSIDDAKSGKSKGHEGNELAPGNA